MEAHRELEFDDRDFESIRSIVYERVGIYLTEAKRGFVYDRLSLRLRKLGIATFGEYRDRLAARDDVEMAELVDAITTSRASFFEDRHVFDHLGSVELERLASGDPDRPRAHVWSAACSTGEEPYSIAITLLESLPARHGRDIRILATDVDGRVIEAAARGVYDEAGVAAIEEPRRRRWFVEGRGPRAGSVRVRDELRDRIRFRQLNLTDRWPMRERFDAVFCRNVVAYFDEDVQRGLLDRFADRLVPGGVLYVGSSESVDRATDRFEPVARSIYRRIR